MDESLYATARLEDCIGDRLRAQNVSLEEKAVIENGPRDVSFGREMHDIVRTLRQVQSQDPHW